MARRDEVIRRAVYDSDICHQVPIHSLPCVGGCQERRAVPMLALLLRPVLGPELYHRPVADRPGCVARRRRSRDEGGAEEQGGAGRQQR